MRPFWCQVALSVGLLCGLVAVLVPDLATRLRARLRTLLDEHNCTQTEFAVALGVSRQTASLILKSPRALQATMTVDRLERTAQFFDIPVSELLLGPGDTHQVLGEDESDLLAMYRMLPPEPKSMLLQFLHWIFEERRNAKTERALNKALRQNIERQIAPPQKMVR